MKILVFSPSWVGDMVMAQTLFKVLHQQHANLTLDVISPPWPYDLLQRMPEVNKHYKIALERGKLGWQARRELADKLKANNYVLAITLPITWKSALIGYWCGAPKRTGYLGEMRYGLLNDRRQLDKEKLPYMVQRYVYLALDAKADMPALSEIPQPKLSVDEKNVALWQQKLALNKDKTLVALMPGAEFGPAKRWPTENYALIAKDLIQKDCTVLLLGSPKDFATAQEIEQKSGCELINLCGKTSLLDAVDLLSCADLAISNDSGLMHIAAAVGISQIAIYRSSTPEFTPPLNDKAIILQAQFNSPTVDKIKLKTLDGVQGFTDVSVESVQASVRTVLSLSN
ncbi:MAG: lipopolysaccharide heptosyltransferase II [Methyloprofundus sp.]|nr:lipopolysaccharide heptosyltransferase II [Methyloprofundus sp.]MDT8425793.1 lipopolysaccharide heptosyltransferase II [Methyloprofundus sp.]